MAKPWKELRQTLGQIAQQEASLEQPSRRVLSRMEIIAEEGIPFVPEAIREAAVLIRDLRLPREVKQEIIEGLILNIVDPQRARLLKALGGDPVNQLPLVQKLDQALTRLQVAQNETAQQEAQRPKGLGRLKRAIGERVFYDDGPSLDKTTGLKWE